MKVSSLNFLVLKATAKYQNMYFCFIMKNDIIGRNPVLGRCSVWPSIALFSLGPVLGLLGPCPWERYCGR